MWKSVLSASEYLCMIICTTETKRACVSVVFEIVVQICGYLDVNEIGQVGLVY